MNFFETLFAEDIVLDEAAFNTAVNEFEDLSRRLQALRNEVEDMVNKLKEGFNTPAGAIFIQSCESNLFSPLDDQKLVLDHISSTLSECRAKYQTVFDEYSNVQAAISKVSP